MRDEAQYYIEGAAAAAAPTGSDSHVGHGPRLGVGRLATRCLLSRRRLACAPTGGGATLRRLRLPPEPSSPPAHSTSGALVWAAPLGIMPPPRLPPPPLLDTRCQLAAPPPPVLAGLVTGGLGENALPAGCYQRLCSRTRRSKPVHAHGHRPGWGGVARVIGAHSRRVTRWRRRSPARRSRSALALPAPSLPVCSPCAPRQARRTGTRSFGRSVAASANLGCLGVLATASCSRDAVAVVAAATAVATVGRPCPAAGDAHRLSGRALRPRQPQRGRWGAGAGRPWQAGVITTIGQRRYGPPGSLGCPTPSVTSRRPLHGLVWATLFAPFSFPLRTFLPASHLPPLSPSRWCPTRCRLVCAFAALVPAMLAARPWP